MSLSADCKMSVCAYVRVYNDNLHIQMYFNIHQCNAKSGKWFSEVCKHITSLVCDRYLLPPFGL